MTISLFILSLGRSPGWNSKLAPMCRGQRETRAGHSRLVSGCFNKQRNLLTYEACPEHPQDKWIAAPTGILNVHRGFSRVQSSTQSRWSQQHVPTSRLHPDMTSSMRTVGGKYTPRTGRQWGPSDCWIQLKGHSTVTSSRDLLQQWYLKKPGNNSIVLPKPTGK